MIDLHNHIIPGLDDGCATYDEALMLARVFAEKGYSSICATPHIRYGMFNNRAEDIRIAAQPFASALFESGIELDFSFAAEYYFDEHLLETLENPSELLTFDSEGRYFLVEFSYRRAPIKLKEFVFNLSLKGLRMVMAHPERYEWLAENLVLAEDLLSMGVVMQGTLSSLAGEMGSRSAHTLKTMLGKGLIQLVSSDCHSPGASLKMLERGLDILHKEVGPEAAKRLLHDNPAKIKEGRSL